MMRSREASTVNQMEDRAEGYRRTERAFWNHFGLDPNERYVEVGSPPTRLRVLEVGTGEPVLFVHGTGGSGAYFAPLVRELREFRCLVLDRPGWGLSSPVDFSGREYKTVIAELLRRTLDELHVERASIVAGSIGNLWALRLAQAYPSRAKSLVLLGGGPLTSAIGSRSSSGCCAPRSAASWFASPRSRGCSGSS
jgi:pimeloyl-ACP methyl ester carboxylesterase